ncbi:MAG: hypothetical protein U0230_20475 [Polyangiales bacterium]
MPRRADTDSAWRRSLARAGAWAAVLALVSGCPRESSGPTTDAAIDAGEDAGADAGEDAAVDAGADAGEDAAVDAGADAGEDARTDAGQDAAVDAGTDAGTDAGQDAGVVPTIVSPPDGSALRARRQVFVWTGGGEGYRLRIGTTPGAADVYESPPLGAATSVTVDGLPLTGVTLHAELSSGPDGARVSSYAT